MYPLAIYEGKEETDLSRDLIGRGAFLEREPFVYSLIHWYSAKRDTHLPQKLYKM
mgnify:CR=1 FL=1